MHFKSCMVSLCFFAASVTASAVKSRQTAFVHPGIFISQGQISYTKQNINSAPWSTAYAAMDSVSWGKITWTATPSTVVRCEDPSSSVANQEKGCKEERYDALSAYSMALRWAYTRQQKYADKAIQIFDGWSSTIQSHVSTSSPEQPGLQSGWVAGLWTRAGEVLRYSGSGWSSASISNFETMLKNVYLPLVYDGSVDNPNNIDSAMLEAAQGIAVFTNNRTLYDAVSARFKQHVRSYIYLTSDGASPNPPLWTQKYRTADRVKALWQNDDSYFQGRTMETCRDLEHTSYGLASISHMMETAYIQGEDLYNTDYGNRLKIAFEVHSAFANGGSVSSTMCKGSLSGTFGSVAEPAYNAMVTRGGGSLPNTKRFVEATRPAQSNSLFTAWETLTHALNPR